MQTKLLAGIVLLFLVLILLIPAVFSGCLDTGSVPEVHDQKSSISGFINDSETGEPIAGASVIVEGTDSEGITDSKGYYHISNVPSGTYTVIAIKNKQEIARFTHVVVR